MRISLTTHGCALWAAAVCAAPAFAQTPATPDVVVVAERRAQPIETLAGNAARLERADLQALGAQAPSEALNRLPGVGVQRNNGVENLPAIRSPVLNGGQSAGSFLFLEDGIPIRAAGFNNVNQAFELPYEFAEAIEVVRGPGSALYGSNAVHGLVNLVTPIAADRVGAPGALEGSLEAGSFGRGRATVLARSPGDGLALGLAAAHEDGWRDASGLDLQRAYLGWEGRLGGWDAQAVLSAFNLNQETAGFIQGQDAFKDEALARSNPTPNGYRDTRALRARVRFAAPAGSDGRIEVTPYARWIEADLAQTFLPSNAQELTDQRGAGLQAAWYYDPDPALSVILGGEVDRTRGGLYEFQTRATVGTFTQGLHYDFTVDATAAAGFAQARWAFAPAWSLTAGLRAERISFDYDNDADVADIGRFRRTADRGDSFAAVTPKLALARRIGARQTAWINLARGARPPQASDLYALQTTQTPGDQEIEFADSAEIGWRGRWAGLRWEIAAFHMDKRDTAFRNADGFTVTGAKTRHQGVEVAGAADLGAGISLSGWGTYAEHTYRSDAIVRSASETIRAGRRIDTAPETLGSLIAAWTPIPAVRAELEWVHVGAYFTDAANTRSYAGHDLANLRASFSPTPALTIAAAVRNLTDEAYAERADFAFGNDRYFPGESRAGTLTVTLRR